MKAFLLGATALVCVSSASQAANLLSNGDFSTSNLSDWSTFVTSDGTIGSPQVVSFDVTGSGAQNAAELYVGQVTHITSTDQEGGGLSQDITTQAGLLTLSAAVAVLSGTNNNAAGGDFSIEVDGVTVATWNAGAVSRTNLTYRDELSTQVSVTAGVHDISFLVTRPYTYASPTSPTQYLTDLSATQALTETAIPEASTWAMMLAGFACLGFVARSASRKAAAIA